ncbi:hypothetical protein Trydic_g8370 [Trypoxylus dichotomus]
MNESSILRYETSIRYELLEEDYDRRLQLSVTIIKIVRCRTEREDNVSNENQKIRMMLDIGLWSQPNRYQIKRDAMQMQRIVRALFPSHPARMDRFLRMPGDFLPFNEEELRTVMGSLAQRRAPGPDNITNEILGIPA